MDYRLFQVPPRFLFAMLAAGAAVGLAVGLVALRARRTDGGLLSLLTDAALGGVGFYLGVIGGFLIPSPSETTTRRVSGVIIRETTKRFQHPYLIALIAALALPLIYELARSRFGKNSRADAP